jgi:hypothetical protein
MAMTPRGDMTHVVVNSCSCPNGGAQGHVSTCPQASDLDRLRAAARRVVDHWDGACDDHPSYRRWDFTEEIDRLREVLR